MIQQGRTAKMNNAQNFLPRAAAFAAVVLVIFSFRFSTCASEGVKPTATGEPVALYIRLCLWSQERPAPTCREVALTPGAAGPLFVSVKACQDGQEEAVRRWRAEAGPVFGFTAMEGDGYRIEEMYCSQVTGRPNQGS
ncbi:MAG TPA: hypothetical protein VGM32_19880 [Rhodopila sp.]